MERSELKLVKGVLIPPERPAEIVNVGRDDLHEYQQLVGGYIEGVTLWRDGPGSEMWAYGFINEDGKTLGLPFNRWATALLASSISQDDYIVGNLVLFGPIGDEGDNTDVADSLLEYLGVP